MTDVGIEEVESEKSNLHQITMNSSFVEDSIRKNIPWSKVSEDVKQVGAKSREFVRGMLSRHMPEII